jgi:hypothetical protein
MQQQPSDPQTGPDRPRSGTTLTIGWREWLALPELGIPAIKAKVDTGARTSALHAFRIETFQHDGREHVRFWIHPLRGREDLQIICEAPVVDRRVVRDSGGHTEERCFIRTTIAAGGREWPAEITLTSREDMLFRMLLGRAALLEAGFRVDPGRSYVLGRRPAGVYPRRRRSKESG